MVSDARAIRFAQEDKAWNGWEKKKRKEKEEKIKEKIAKSSTSVGSHISFEVGKPTSGVLTSPSGTTFRKIILLGAKAISIDSPRDRFDEVAARERREEEEEEEGMKTRLGKWRGRRGWR